MRGLFLGMVLQSAFLIIFLAGSASFAYDQDERPAAESALLKRWWFVGFQDMNSGLKDLLPRDLEVDIEFESSAEGSLVGRSDRVRGKGPCNIYQGFFRSAGAGRIAVSAITSTEKFCGRKRERQGEKTIMEWEDLYLRGLEMADSYEIRNDELRLSFNHGAEALLFRRKER